MWKTSYRLSQAINKIQPLLFNHCLSPCFNEWREQIKENYLISNQYHDNVLLLKCFNGWKEEAMMKKLKYVGCLKRKLIRWHDIAIENRILKPYVFYETRKKFQVFQSLKLRKEQNSQRKRNLIIFRQIQKNRKAQYLKIGILGLLENLLHRKKQKILYQSAKEFCDINLRKKALFALYHFVDIESTARTSRIQNNLKLRAFENWKQYALGRNAERQIVLRFRQFRNKILLTRVFLLWRDLKNDPFFGHKTRLFSISP